MPTKVPPDKVQRLDWNNWDCGGELSESIADGKRFTVKVPLHDALPELVVFGAHCSYALSKGYRITRKGARREGQVEWDFTPPTVG